MGIENAVASEAKPKKPPPPWPDPIPLAVLPEAEDFPVQVLPPQARQLIEAAASMVCPTDYLGTPMLVLAGAAIGNSRALRIKVGYVERPRLYALVIGGSGTRS